MSPSSMQAQTSIESLEAVRGTSSPKSQSHSPIGHSETDSERSIGPASSLSRSVRYNDCFQRELPFTMQRWLADTDTGRVTTGLLDFTKSPAEICPPDQNDGDIPTTITDTLSTRSTHGTVRTLRSSAGRTRGGYEDMSLRKVGTWCSEDDLRESLENECKCQATQELVAIAKVLRSSLKDLRFVSVRIRNILSDIEMAKLSISE